MYVVLKKTDLDLEDLDFIIAVKDKVHKKNERNVSKTADKYILFGEGDALEKICSEEGFKFDLENCFLAKKPEKVLIEDRERSFNIRKERAGEEGSRGAGGPGNRGTED